MLRKLFFPNELGRSSTGAEIVFATPLKYVGNREECFMNITEIDLLASLHVRNLVRAIHTDSVGIMSNPVDITKYLGKTAPTVTVSFTKKDLILYAIGIGCTELNFVYVRSDVGFLSSNRQVRALPELHCLPNLSDRAGLQRN